MVSSLGIDPGSKDPSTVTSKRRIIKPNSVLKSPFSEAAINEFKVTKNELKELLGYCRAEQLLFDLLAGRNDDSSDQTIAIMLGVCCGCAGLVLDYLLTLIFGCAHVRSEGHEYA